MHQRPATAGETTLHDECVPRGEDTPRGSPPASSSATFDGTGSAWRAWVVTSSALHAPDSIPITASPTFHDVTRVPSLGDSAGELHPEDLRTAHTRGSGYPPWRCIVSARLMALLTTRTRISSDAGTGSATSWTAITSGPPYE